MPSLEAMKAYSLGIKTRSQKGDADRNPLSQGSTPVKLAIPSVCPLCTAVSRFRPTRLW
jgi:hypothetical protein